LDVFGQVRVADGFRTGHHHARPGARGDLFEWIESSTTARGSRALGFKSPADFETKLN
jgi:hypothetical protein